jgi:CRISPR/Cas system-associated exonuclease Cas4 (RecB family)
LKSFLQELAEQIYKEHQQLDGLTLVFPNRRAALYFHKHLSSLLTKPAFAPRLFTIEDFISDFSELKVPDKLELVHRLHATYKLIMTSPGNDKEGEPFDQFYFWGEMLLRDFDEVDKYIVDAEQLFKDLRNQKELDSSFDYLTKEQREFLQKFWLSFEENLTKNKQSFLEIWNKLFLLYKTYKSELKAVGLGYEGMVHRELADRITSIDKKDQDFSKIMFVGFNALTKAEEKIISHYVEQGSQLYWDGDEYYVNDIRQEAGKFMREYHQHSVLKKTLSVGFPSNFRQPKFFRVFGSAQPIGQTKLMAQVLKEELTKGIAAEDTLIVLPDEKLLIPVLHGISGNVDKLNVTMGFALSSTPLFNLIELLMELQMGTRRDHFSHRQVLPILGHPYVVAADTISANVKRKEILFHNWVNIPESFLGASVELHRLIFRKSEVNPLAYLASIIQEIGKLESISALDKEFAFQFLKLLNRIKEVLYPRVEDVKKTSVEDGRERNKSLKSFLRLLRQLVRAQKIPFVGEPLLGLQVMGVLETRNLDFKNVFILSMNEGAFPSFGSKGSYIPFNIRKAYDLPTVEHQDAMYAYLFYRVIQRAENVFLFYNSETDVLGQGEMSRYLKQLIYEGGFTIKSEVLHNSIKPEPVKPIIIRKDEKVLQALTKLNSDPARVRGISPSALNAYIECKLKFYFRYIARIKEPDEVEEDLDARVLGIFLHEVMETFYKKLYERKKNKSVEAGDFENVETVIDQLIDEAFIKTYRLEPGKKVEYEGQRLVVKEVVKRIARRIMEIDQEYAPFVVEAVEQEGLLYNVKISHAPGYAVVGGKIDRVDRKGNEVRIIDYKTGKDKLDFESVASLFVRNERRNKAAFQTMVYALLYKTTSTLSEGTKLVPGLMSRANIFEDTFEFGLKMDNQLVTDVDKILPDFEIELKSLLEDIYNPDGVFDQTTLTETCKFCPYQNICYR